MKDPNKEPLPDTLAVRLSRRQSEQLLRDARRAGMKLADYCRWKLSRSKRTATKAD